MFVDGALQKSFENGSRLENEHHCYVDITANVVHFQVASTKFNFYLNLLEKLMESCDSRWSVWLMLIKFRFILIAI